MKEKEKKKTCNRTDAYAAIFLEIRFQEEGGFTDKEAIANVYSAYSTECLISAQMIAAGYEIEAKNV